MSLQDFLANLAALAPEIVLSMTICAALLSDMFVPLAKSCTTTGIASMLGLFFALVAVGLHPGSSSYFGGLILSDHLSALFKLFLIGGTGLSILIGMGSNELRGQRFGEFATLTLGVCLGGCLLASTNNLVLFVVALETVSLCAYALSGFARHDRLSAEASLKYVLYGALVSGVMLFGLSYLYGLTGTLELNASIQRLATLGASGSFSAVAGLVIALLGAGVAFKIAAVPFQFWAPDVYQGSPTAVTAFLSVVSKGAGFAALIRLCAPAISALPGAAHGLQALLGIMAVLSMTFGNLAAIRQTDVKRLLAYSSIAHAGYMLMALAVFTPQSIEAVLIYLFIYLFMNLGAFWITVVVANDRGSTALQAFKGGASGSPVAFIVLFLCLVSLTGLPPTAGFVAKFALFKEVVGAAILNMGTAGELTFAATMFFALAVIGVLNSVVSLFYYMKIARAMALDKSDVVEQPLALGHFQRLYAIGLAVPLLLLLNFGPLFSLVSGVFKPARAFFLH